MIGSVESFSQEGEKHKADITCMVFMDGFLYSGGQDGSVKIWDADLKLKRSINLFGAENYVYAICVDVNGRLYAAGSNGILKCLPSPISSDNAKDIYTSTESPVQTLYCHGESVWAGDGMGILIHFENCEKIRHYEMIEEIKGLAVDGNLVYTIRDMDLMVSELIPDKAVIPGTQISVKAVVPGRAPLKLVGNYVNGRRSLIVTATRDGKGLSVLNNCHNRDYVKVWHKDNCHEMIINAISGNEKTLFTSGYDGVLKMWLDINDLGQLGGELVIGNCVNTLCHGPNDHTVFVGTSDGIVRKVIFKPKN